MSSAEDPSQAGKVRSEALRAQAESALAKAPPTVGPPRSQAGLAHELRVHEIELEMQNAELRKTQIELESSRDHFVELYDFAPVGYFSLSDEGTVTQANLTGAHMLGLERSRLIGRRFSNWVSSTHRDRWHRHALALHQRSDPGRIELLMTAQDGHGFYAQIDAVRVQAEGCPPALHLTLSDTTERKRSEGELRVAAAAFETQEGIVITDARGLIQRVNTAFSQLTGYSAEEAIGKNVTLLHSTHHDEAFYTTMREQLNRDGRWKGEVWTRRKNGEVYAEWLTISAVRDEEASVTRYVRTMLDISLRKSREAEIERLAFYDPLTGLPNRRLMADRLNQAMAVSARSQREGALMFIDLDNFKTINDTLGHAKGDQLLQQAAQRLSACVREGDTVARPGGDEFVVMLSADLSALPEEAMAQAKSVGKKILAALNRPYDIAGQSCVISASIGVVLFRDHLIAAQELIRRADHAMYQAKTAGRNTLRFYDSAVHQQIKLRSAIEEEIRKALQQGEFVLYYQPEVDSKQQLLGAEALVRWQHPSRGLLAPGEFIAIAEDSGQIEALGRWVLQTACAQLASWSRDPDMARLRLSVNISVRELRDPRFVQHVLGVLERSGAPLKQLKLELTESMMLENFDDTIAKMNAIRAHGVGFSLDDFGTGYASLTHLKRLPLDCLKVDRSFVRDLLSNPRDAAIARTIVALGHNLDLIVVAEGVETEAQRDLLQSFGCQAYQGYLFGAAAPVEVLNLAAHSAAQRGASAPTPASPR